MRPVKCHLILASLILLCSLASPAVAGTVHNNKTAAPVPGNSVLILAPTVTGGAASIEATQALALGFDVVINDAATWSSMTQADFASYRAIILGDPGYSTSTVTIAAAEANRTTWSPAITGNMIIIGVDPVIHPDNSIPVSKGTELTQKGIAFAAADPTKTGAYITLSGYYVYQVTAIPLLLLDQFDTGFLVKQAPPGFNNAHIVATHPAFAGLTDAELSNWGQSVHEVIEQWPASFEVFAIAPNVGSFYTATDGKKGTPYILTRGASVISNIKLGPDDAINPLGTNHTVTATISPVPPTGTPVTFKVISGPNAGSLNPPVGTDASGVASKTYTGAGGIGTDLIVATYAVNGTVQTSNTVKKTWVEEAPKACADVVTREVSCKMDGSGAITYIFSVTNNTGQAVSNVLLTPPAGSAFTLSQQQFSVALAPGQTQAITVVVTGVTPGQKVCFTVTLGNFTALPATKDCSECCCSVEVCFIVPTCDCVQFIDESLQPVKGKPNTFTYTFVIKNPLPTTIEHIYIYAPTGYTMTPSYLPVSIAPGGVFTGTITITATPGVKSCFSISFHDKALKKCCTMRHCIALK